MSKEEKEENNPLDLPEEVFYTIADLLDTTGLARGKQVSKEWGRFLADKRLWRQKIISDFKLTKEFINELDNRENDDVYFLIYKRLSNVTKKRQLFTLIKIFDSAIRGDVNQKLFVDCLLDDPNLLKQISIEDFPFWFAIATLVGCEKIPKAIMKFLPIDSKLLNNVVIQSGNLDLISKVIKSNVQFPLDYANLSAAFRSGNLDVVKTVATQHLRQLNTLNQDIELEKQIIDYVRYVKSEKLLSCALGSLETTKYMIEKIGVAPYKGILSDAILIGNTKVIQYLLDVLKVVPDEDTFKTAVFKRNISLFNNLLTNYNKINFVPTQNVLNIAADSGSLASTEYFINLYHLIPNNETLESAARSGSLNLMKFLLDPKNNFNLEINEIIYQAAIQSGNVEVVEFLISKELEMKKENSFNNLKSDPQNVNFAIVGNSLAMVKFLIDAGFEVTADNLVEAAAMDNLIIFKYLLSNLNDTPINMILKSISPTNLFVERYFFDLKTIKLFRKIAKPADEMQDCHNYFMKFLNSEGDSPTHNLDLAMKAHPELFFNMVETMLTEYPDNPLTNTIIQNKSAQLSPLPLTQCIIAQAAMQGEIELDDTEIEKLLTKAITRLKILGGDEAAEPAETALSQLRQQKSLK